MAGWEARAISVNGTLGDAFNGSISKAPTPFFCFVLKENDKRKTAAMKQIEGENEATPGKQKTGKKGKTKKRKNEREQERSEKQRKRHQRGSEKRRRERTETSSPGRSCEIVEKEKGGRSEEQDERRSEEAITQSTRLYGPHLVRRRCPAQLKRVWFD